MRNPRCSIELSRTDWRIIKSFSGNPTKTYRTVAAELGISSKTVNRRVEKMTEGKAIFVVPRMNPKAAEGVIIADMVVFLPRQQRKAELDQTLRNHLSQYLLWGDFGADYCIMQLHLPHISKVGEVLEWANEQPGVQSTRIGVLQDSSQLFEIFSEQIDRQLTCATEFHEQEMHN